jgi:tRNA(Ile)-lysidine synthetase-like protein
MLDVKLEPGRYVVAVSGGVDSVVLLDLLARQHKTLTVAHFDHGIRDDAKYDRELVQKLAGKYGLPFVYHEGKLGAGASEAVARKVRYDFLHQVRQAAGAQSIVTAHHQDDLIETAFLNLMRGTGRKGLSSLRSTDVIKRPLLHLPKAEIVKYARDNQLVWHEDSTNQDERYLRNHVRLKITPQMSPQQRQKLLALLDRVHEINKEIDSHLITHLHVQPALNRLDRQALISLPYQVGLELLAAWLRLQGIRGFDSKALRRLLVAALTFQPGQKADVIGGYMLLVGRDDLTLQRATARPGTVSSV